MAEILSAGVKSWRTTFFGTGGAAILLFNQVMALADQDPTTLCDWGIVATSIGIAVAFFYSRDNGVTSEEAGANG